MKLTLKDDTFQSYVHDKTAQERCSPSFAAYP